MLNAIVTQIFRELQKVLKDFASDFKVFFPDFHQIKTTCFQALARRPVCDVTMQLENDLHSSLFVDSDSYLKIRLIKPLLALNTPVGLSSASPPIT